MGKIIDLETLQEMEAEKHMNDPWPSNICAMCELEFEEGQTIYTDGFAYFCEDCVKAMKDNLLDKPK